MSPSSDRERVLVIGEALIDIVERDSGLEEHVGGSPLNVAIGLARLNVDVTFATEFAADRHGELIGAHLADAGITTVQTADATRTSTARARIGADGSASYSFDLDWRFAQPPASAGFSVVHVGSIGALRLPGAAAVLDLIEALPETVLVTFDPNIRPALLPERRPTRELVESYARRAAIVKLSDEDAEWLYPGRPTSAPARLLKAGARVVVVTHGATGSAIHTADGFLHIDPLSAVVTDTIGAGDAYMSGLIGAIVRRQSVAAAARGKLGASDLEEIGRVAAAAAGITVGRAGAVPPTEHELALALT